MGVGIISRNGVCVLIILLELGLVEARDVCCCYTDYIFASNSR